MWGIEASNASWTWTYTPQLNTAMIFCYHRVEKYYVGTIYIQSKHRIMEVMTQWMIIDVV